MDIDTIARALHVLAIVHWIGGVSFVTLVVLPSINRHPVEHERPDLFERLERFFAPQAKASVLIAGMTGLYLVWKQDMWGRFLEPGMWWMHAMLVIWAIFALVLFVAEPLVLHNWFQARAARAPASTMRLAWRAHVVLLTLSVVTAGSAVLGAHGALF